VGRYQKGKTYLDISQARDGEWQWHQLGHMQVCTSIQTNNNASTQPLSFFTGRIPFLPPKQQRQSIKRDTETILTKNCECATLTATINYHRIKTSVTATLTVSSIKLL